MNNESIKSQITNLFTSKFNKEKYKDLLFKMFDKADFTKTFDCNNFYIPEKFRNDIKSYSRIGKYTDINNQTIDFLLVNLINKNKLEKARTTQKNFISHYLNGSRSKGGGKII